MNNKTYDFLKKYLLAILNGGATLIITLGKIWGIPHSEAIAGTLSALAFFITYVINHASDKYFEDKEIVDRSIVDENKSLG